MKKRLTHNQEIELGHDAKTSVYISEYNEAVQITLRDRDEREETHVIEIEIPLAIARNLVCVFVTDLGEHDDKKVTEEI